MVDIPDALKAALADRYRIERELGAGGMATVWLAHDLKHDRDVALKVLRPELAAALGGERFLREIRITAQLSHPHILPLLDSGEAAGFLYYVMPFIREESLRDRLDREGPLPLDEALRIAGEVADALAYAHGQGIIHRDVKPENVLLQAGHAVVADFGIAQAVSAVGDARLTATGFSPGSPAYMSPEQAAGTQTLDARCDVYALGCVLHELLAGEPPYTGPTAQALLAKKLTVSAPRISVVRETVPPAIEAALAKALARNPADRFASAAQFAAALAAGAAPAVAEPIPLRAAGTLVGAGVALLALTRAMVLLLGLPDWLWRSTVALVSVGVVAVLAVEWLGRRGRRPWLTQHRALAAGGVALLLTVLSGAGYLTSRALGVGPFATPISRGLLESRVRVVLADFVPVGVDTVVADAVTELLRTDLEQSATVRTLPRTEVQDALARMRREGARLDARTAQELAQREGLAAVIGGELRRVAGQYLLLGTITAVADGAVLVSARETARDSTGLIDAAGRLSRRLREQVGENLRAVRASQPLEHATTASFPALVAFTEASAASFRHGDPARAIRLLEEAVAYDTTFASAYTMLSVVNMNSGRAAPARAAAEQAYRFRDRLPERERLLVEWTYYSARGDLGAEEDRLLRILQLDPNFYPPWSALSDLRLRQRRFAEAESLALHALDLGDRMYTATWNAVEAQVARERFAAADSTMARSAPESADVVRGQLLLAKRDYRAARAYYDSLRREDPSNGPTLARLALLQGRLAEAERQWGDVPNLWRLRYRLRYRLADSAAVFRELGQELARMGWDSLPPAERPTWLLVALQSELGRVTEAKRHLAEWQTRAAGELALAEYVDLCEAQIALAEGRLDAAAAAFLRWHEAPFSTATHIYNRGLVEAGAAFDRLGRADTAVALFERALHTRTLRGLSYETLWYPFVLHRLGELHESLGHRDQAIDYYGRFIDLWKDADPELQPQVAAARSAVARLAVKRD